MKNCKPVCLACFSETTQVQSHRQKVFLELGSLLRGGDEENEKRYSLSETKDYPTE
jgi:hypothetical protein